MHIFYFFIVQKMQQRCTLSPCCTKSARKRRAVETVYCTVSPSILLSCYSVFIGFRQTLITILIILAISSIFLFIAYICIKKRQNNNFLLKFFKLTKNTTTYNRNDMNIENINMRPSAPIKRVDSFTAKLLWEATQSKP